jgi:hypothetical protein
MAKKKPAPKSAAEPEWEGVDSPGCSCECGEVEHSITELGRQVHLLGVIIDELVSEFQWQNNQMATYIRQADDAPRESRLIARGDDLPREPTGIEPAAVATYAASPDNTIRMRSR